MNNIEIVDAVKSGMRNAAIETRFMNFNSRGKISAEYFATVSIGLALRNNPSFQFDDEKIMFEYSTGDFITSTVPLTKKLTLGNFFSRIIRRIRENTTRKGRIDIAILGNDNGIDYPKCAIEVKGDNPSKALLHADIRRNIEYFKHSGATGKSELTLTLNCAFEAYDNNSKSKKSCFTKTERNARIAEIENKYISYINEIKHEIPRGISESIEVFSASEQLADPNYSQEEYYHIEDHIHLVLGVLIKLER